SVHGVMECQRSGELRRIFNSAGMVTPDGMPLVWLARGRDPQVTRVYGPDLMLAESQRSIAAGHRHFLYGGGPGVSARLATAMRERIHGLAFADTMETPFALLDQLAPPEPAAAIKGDHPDIARVGLRL